MSRILFEMDLKTRIPDALRVLRTF